MSSPTVDYAALAKQAGAISSSPPSGTVDYTALAKQAGAIESTPAQAVDNPPQQTYLSQLLDTARAKIGEQKPVPPQGDPWRPAVEIGNMGNQLLQSIYDLLPPNVANELYKKRAGLPNRLHEIPEEAVMTVGPMAAGGEDRPASGEAPAPVGVARPAAASTPAPSSGMLGEVARHLPYVGKYIRLADRLGEFVDAIQGKTQAPPAPLAPSVPPWWGKQVGREIGPPEQWGQRIQPVASHAPTATAPVEAATEAKIPGEAPRQLSEGAIPRTYSGESALNQVLTRLDNKTLLKVARSRGVDVTKEAQLKPSVADVRIIRKIVDDFSPDELQDVRDTYLESSRMRPAPWEGSSPEDWHVRVLQQYFGDVAIPQAMLKRVQKARSVSLSELLGAVTP